MKTITVFDIKATEIDKFDTRLEAEAFLQARIDAFQANLKEAGKSFPERLGLFPLVRKDGIELFPTTRALRMRAESLGIQFGDTTTKTQGKREVAIAKAEVKYRDGLCERCRGEKIFTCFYHVEGGVCFRCEGTGIDPKATDAEKANAKRLMKEREAAVAIPETAKVQQEDGPCTHLGGRYLTELETGKKVSRKTRRLHCETCGETMKRLTKLEFEGAIKNGVEVKAF